MTVIAPEYGVKFTLECGGNKAVFNEPSDPNYVGPLDPTQCSGLDSPEVREDAWDRVEDDGGIHGDFYYGRRPVILAGSISGSSITQRNERSAKLIAASNAMREDATLKWTPTGGVEVELKLRRQQPLRITGGVVKAFQCALVAADPRIKAVSATEQTVETAAQTGKAPEEVVSEGTGTAWTNPSNAKTSDNIYATVSLASAESAFLRAKKFGFTLPSGSVAASFWASTERKSSGASTIFTSASQLGGTAGLWSNSQEVYEAIFHWSTTEEVFKTRPEWVRPGNVPVWEWSYFLVNEPEFGFRFKANNIGTAQTASVDQITMSVYYAPEVTVANNGTANAGGTIKVTMPAGATTVTTIGISIRERRLIFEGIELKAEQTLEINLDNKTAKIGNTNVYGKINQELSDWTKFTPGSNAVYLTASDIQNTGVKLIVKHQDSWV